MTTRVPMNVLLIVCLCAPLLTSAQATAQVSDAVNRANHEQAARISEKIVRSIKAKEPKWRFKDVVDDGAAYQRDGVWQVEMSAYQRWVSGAGELTLTIFVYESSQEASRMQKQRSHYSSVASPDKLGGFGDEAYITHRYFSWVSVRKGKVSIEVHGPPALMLTRRFAQSALDQIEDQ